MSDGEEKNQSSRNKIIGKILPASGLTVEEAENICENGGRVIVRSSGVVGVKYPPKGGESIKEEE